jgi:hypothetical protein
MEVGMDADFVDPGELETDASGLGEGPLAALERMIIEAYLAGKNIKIEDLKTMPPEEAQDIMKEASTYASTKLAEVESKAQFKREIHYDI